MKKVFFVNSPIALSFLLFAGTAFAQADAVPQRIVIEEPHRATFYLHTDSNLDKDFNKIIKGKDPVIGEDLNGVKIKSDAKTGCFYREGSPNGIYHQDLLDSLHMDIPAEDDAADSYYNFTPSIAWKDTNPTNDMTFVYDPAALAHKCADVKPEKTIKKKLDYKGQVGGRGGFNPMLYEPKKPLKSAELKKLYKKAVFESGKKPKFADFVKMHPLIYIYDGFGLYHRLLNAKFKFTNTKKSTNNQSSSEIASLTEAEYDEILKNMNPSMTLEIINMPNTSPFVLFMRSVFLPNFRSNITQAKLADIFIGKMRDYNGNVVAEDLNEEMYVNNVSNNYSDFQSHSFNLPDGKTVKDIKQIDGKIVFRLPINITELIFTPQDIGKKKTIGNSSITLKSMEQEDGVRFYYEGPAAHYIVASQVFGSNNQELTINQIARIGSEIHLIYDNQRIASELHLFVAKSIVEREFPFTLTGPFSK